MPVRMRVAHLSDPHFGTVVPAVREALHAELHAQPPDLILLTGDITQRARRDQFVQARDFLASLPAVPRLCLPGNHDLPLFDLVARAVKPYDYYRQFISRDLQPQYVDDRIAVLCVDATSRFRHKDGKISQRQVEHTAAQLTQTRRPFRIVATHQPLAALVGSDRSNVAHGAERALDRWIAAGADLFLGGHIHLPYCLEVRTSDHRDSSVLLQAGTCLSRRVRDGIPNSYNLITLQRTGAERRILVERRDYDAASDRFILARRDEAGSMMDRGRTGLNGWRLTAQGEV
ncbi:MAG: metallophosphoesterase [Steroidobacteraceae bacterium]